MIWSDVELAVGGSGCIVAMNPMSSMLGSITDIWPRAFSTPSFNGSYAVAKRLIRSKLNQKAMHAQFGNTGKFAESRFARRTESRSTSRGRVMVNSLHGTSLYLPKSYMGTCQPKRLCAELQSPTRIRHDRKERDYRPYTRRCTN